MGCATRLRWLSWLRSSVGPHIQSSTSSRCSELLHPRLWWASKLVIAHLISYLSVGRLAYLPDHHCQDPKGRPSFVRTHGMISRSLSGQSYACLDLSCYLMNFQILFFFHFAERGSCHFRGNC